jgi:27-O-demethylrifamycin SV methyltransferase
VTDVDHAPASHYDWVTEAWGLLLGDDLHYGVWDSPDESLTQAQKNLTRRMVDGAQLSPGQRVLDVGCGTGSPACDLAEKYGVQVVGITTSAVGVEAARARAEERGLGDLVSFELRDGTDNGFPDGSFDRVWVLESSHLMAEREQLISECARVLRPGGRVVLCDLLRHRIMPFAELRSRTAEFATLRRAHGSARMEPLPFYTDTATGFGLTVDHTEDLTHATLPTFDAWRANAERHADAVRAAIGQDGLDDFVESMNILESLWRDGTMGYGLFSAVRPAS